MKCSNFFKFLVSALIFVASITSLATDTEGGASPGGGDHVRATFLQIGNNIIKFLLETEQGRIIVSSNKLSIDELKSTLDVHKIQVSIAPLRDNTGSKVDATGEKGKIVLYRDSMLEHFESNRDISYLVFHEMLRSTGINDDNYPISKALNPMPENWRLQTRMVRLETLVTEDNIRQSVRLGSPAFGGSGCKVGSDTVIELNELSNTLDVITNQFEVKSRPDSIERQTCNIALPFELAKGKRLVVTQLDVSGKVALAPNAKLGLASEVFLAGSQGTRAAKSYVANSNGKKGRVFLRAAQLFKSSCGGSGMFRINFSGVLNGQDSTAEISKISSSFSIENCN